MLRLTRITFASDDLARLAGFWADVLGYETEARDKTCAGLALAGDPG
jgi:catechol-2,3-dioxygenase